MYARKEVTLMQIAICDDDLDFAKQLETTLGTFFKNRSLKLPDLTIYNNGKDLINDPITPDIAFLDIRMSDPDGITIGESLKKKNPYIIIFIVTAYPEYLDEAMQIQAFRFIQKPIDEQRLYNGLEYALKAYNTTVQKIPIETKNGVFTVNSADIIYVQTLYNTTTIITNNGEYQSPRKMSYWKEVLNLPCFVNCHRSYIVNLKYVTSFDRHTISLCDGQYTAYLTERKYSQFKKSYLLFLESIKW